MIVDLRDLIGDMILPIIYIMKLVILVVLGRIYNSSILVFILTVGRFFYFMCRNWNLFMLSYFDQMMAMVIVDVTLRSILIVNCEIPI